jgi:polyisoprenoid-binding protein YceI
LRWTGGLKRDSGWYKLNFREGETMKTCLKRYLYVAGLMSAMGCVNSLRAQDFSLSSRPIGAVPSRGSIVHTDSYFDSTRLSLLPASGAQAAPVFEITPGESSIKFDVEASVAIKGTFDKWDASLTFASPDVETGVLDIKIQAATVDTGSGMKNGKLKGKDFFDVEHSPSITFKSTKIVQTGPNTFELDGDFTIRGVTKAEKLTLTLTGKGTGSGEVKGTMAFDRKQYGMNSGIPFIKIADRVEVNVALKGKRVSGPPLVFKQ